MGEAGRMTFGKSIFAKALDLVEAALGKIRIIAALDHPPYHHIFQLMHHPARPERCHRFAQSVGLKRREFCCIERNLHRLLLKDRNTKRALQNARQLVRRAVFGRRRRDCDLFCPSAALEIGMHHIALNRPRAHNRNLDHQIIKLARFEARQHIHLRAALDLKNAERIPLAQHRIGFRILARDSRERQRAPVMLLQQIEAFLDASEHAEGQHIHFQNTQSLNIILVPLDKRAVGHRAIANRHCLGKRALGEDKTADMLREMPRHSDHLLGQGKHAAKVRIGQLHADLLDMRLANLAAMPAPNGARQSAGDIFGKPHRLTHFADRHARAVMDDSRGQASTVAAIFRVNILDHLLAPLMLEINVDIGRLLALFRDEAVEQELMLGRINAGDLKAVTHRRIGRRAASLAQDGWIDAAGEIDDILDGEEIARKVELCDQGQLALQRIAHHLRRPLRITPRCPRPCLSLEIFLRGHTVWINLLRIFIFELFQREIARIRHRPRSCNRMGPARKQLLHFLRRFEVPLTIRVEQMPRLRHSRLVPDCGHHILQRTALGCVIMDIIGRQQFQPVRPRQSIKPVDPRLIITKITIMRRQIAQPRQPAGQMRQKRRQIACDITLQIAPIKRNNIVDPSSDSESLAQIVGRNQDQLHRRIAGILRQHSKRDVAITLGLPFAIKRFHPSGRDQLAQCPIGCTVPGISEECEPLHSLDPRSDYRF